MKRRGKKKVRSKGANLARKKKRTLVRGPNLLKRETEKSIFGK